MHQKQHQKTVFRQKSEQVRNTQYTEIWCTILRKVGVQEELGKMENLQYHCSRPPMLCKIHMWTLNFFFFKSFQPFINQCSVAYQGPGHVK